MKTRQYAINFTKPTRTKQSFKDDCDINLIVKKYKKTGLITHVQKVQGKYGDFTTVTDYQTAMNSVMDANDRFDGLPSDIRKQFQNDPQKLIAFVTDQKNYGKAHEMGLLSPEASAAYLESLKPKSTLPETP